MGFLCPDGAGAGKNAAEVHADDEPGVAACHFRGRGPAGARHGPAEAAS